MQQTLRSIRNLPKLWRQTATKQTVQPAHRYPETAITLDDMGKSELRVYREYRKTYAFSSPFINANHERLQANTAPGALIEIGIDGWLLADDALKLYELAYFTSGNVLELGTYMGLSTSIMAGALRADAGAAGRIDTVELDAERSEAAKASMQSRDADLASRVTFTAEEGATFMDQRRKAGATYSLAFVDHSHRVQDVKAASERLPALIEPGGFVLYHDFNDIRNAENHPDYGVFQGVRDGLSKKHFEFWGCFGCTGLYRKLGF